MSEARGVAIGAMRLSTEPARADDRSLATLHAAFDAGVTLVDTADAYALDDRDRGHNERLLARALAAWGGDRSRVRFATKGGLTRPGGRWVPDGRARHLRSAAEASRRALGVERIHLYQLHAVDPAVPLATSVRALAALRADGVVEQVGLCNVTLGQLREAADIVPVASVQVELSPWCDDALRNGVLEHCRDHGLQVLAYRPLGGRDAARRLLDPVLQVVAGRHGASPAEVVLAWLRSLADVVVPLPGPTRSETAVSAARSASLVLTPADLAELDARFPAARNVRVPRERRRPAPGATGDVVLVMGLPGAGKSTTARALVDDGYARLNRDEAGGTLRDLVRDLDALLAAGHRRVVLDNTYGSRAARNAVIETAWIHGVPARCVWIDTSVEDAQVNVCRRMVERYGRLLGPEEMRRVARKDPGVLAPGVVYRHRREMEPPGEDEGFRRVDVSPFERRHPPGRSARGLILDYDTAVWRSRSGARTPASPQDLDLLPGRADVLRRAAADGWRVLGTTWQPDVAAGSRSAADVEAVVAAAQSALGLEIDVVVCPHAAGPSTCWCRKPLPGLGVVLLERHRLDAAASVLVSGTSADQAVARALGLGFRGAADLFGG